MYLRTTAKRGYETQRDKDGKRIFSDAHRKRLSGAARRRYEDSAK
jgi:hypothetical protein